MSEHENRRILIVDDNPDIHSDFEKLLSPAEVDENGAALDALADDLFGDDPGAAPVANAMEAMAFELEHAHQGEEAIAMVEAALDARRPYAMAFVDVRMPPGMDGVRTARRLFELDSELLVVMCTAFSDYSRDEMFEQLGRPERYLILKKPFDGIEVQQLASTLTAKWELQREVRSQLAEIRSFASSLEAVNAALAADKALAESRAQDSARFLHGAGRCFAGAAGDLRRALGTACGANDVDGLADLERRGRDLHDGLEELSEFTALQAGLARVERAEQPFAPVLSRVRERVGARAASAGLQLECVGPLEVPEQVELDAERVERTLDVLATFAVTGSTGSTGEALELSCSTRRSKALGTLELEFELAYAGTHLDAERREALLRPFQSTDSGSVHELALPLGHQLAECLGGSLVLESGRDGRNVLRLRFDPGPIDAGSLRELRWDELDAGRAAA